MSLFGKKEKEELERIKEQLSPEQNELINLTDQINNARTELSRCQQGLYSLQQEFIKKQQELTSLQQQIIETDEVVLLQSFGMYTPHYLYTTSAEYSNQIKYNRELQKNLIKNNTAVIGNNNWQVNGNVSQGKKMVKDMQKLLLRAFNAECDDAIEHVRFNSIDAAQKKIYASATSIAKLGSIMGIAVSTEYYDLKRQELRLMFEYQQIKQKEKEEAKEARARQREDAKVARELEEERRKLEKEQIHYTNALDKARNQLDKCASDIERESIEKKISELEAQLNEIDTAMHDVDYRTANQKAGYVYIISNIGAFGENVYKIGMTRRLDPNDRIDELGDASVPFNFDVHAMIFTDDAPKLEAALHNAFADRKVNFVNQRREFFNVSLEEIKAVVRQNYDKTVEFTDVPPAEQYRESLILRQQNTNQTSSNQ